MSRPAYGPNHDAVELFLLNISQLSDEDLAALAVGWRPSIEFLAAGAAAWKAARKAGIYAQVQAAYDAVYDVMPASARIGTLFNATQIAGNVMITVALGTRLDPLSRERLIAPWRRVFPNDLA